LRRDAVAKTNQTLPDERRIAMRIGINFGDIIVEDGDVFGDGVNIAARVEALAKPGSVCVSEIVRNQVADKVDFDFEDLGPQDLKNIARPIRVYRMSGEMAELSEHLLAAGATRASAPVFDDRRAIAVLPFANFSGDPEQEFFADGITEDIISMSPAGALFPSSRAIRPSRTKARRSTSRKPARNGRALRPRRQRAQIGSPGPRHDAVDRGRHEPSHNGREVRSRPHRPVRAAGRARVFF
jgi:hypothetical protein